MHSVSATSYISIYGVGMCTWAWTLIVLALSARTLVVLPLSTIYITMDLIVIVFDIPPELLYQYGYLMAALTNFFFSGL